MIYACVYVPFLSHWCGVVILFFLANHKACVFATLPFKIILRAYASNTATLYFNNLCSRPDQYTGNNVNWN